ncbi:Chlorophyllase [Dillenia turbinata]|uniref:Chlorophyllase n=1 Tax=Dillenia turbinata TaxID=194707 RepID=A0AAN8ZMA7_9MAGN
MIFWHSSIILANLWSSFTSPFKSLNRVAESDSTSTLLRLHFLANNRPSLKPQISAISTSVFPTMTWKPVIQIPSLSLIKPPAPALPEDLSTAPSELSFTDPCLGGMYITSGPYATGEINSTTTLINWLFQGLQSLLPSQVRPNLNKPALAGHIHRGNHLHLADHDDASIIYHIKNQIPQK